MVVIRLWCDFREGVDKEVHTNPVSELLYPDKFAGFLLTWRADTPSLQTVHKMNYSENCLVHSLSWNNKMHIYSEYVKAGLEVVHMKRIQES